MASLHNLTITFLRLFVFAQARTVINAVNVNHSFCSFSLVEASMSKFPSQRCKNSRSLKQGSVGNHHHQQQSWHKNDKDDIFAVVFVIWFITFQAMNDDRFLCSVLALGWCLDWLIVWWNMWKSRCLKKVSFCLRNSVNMLGKRCHFSQRLLRSCWHSSY